MNMLKIGKEKPQAKNIGIDLGTANMLVYLEGDGIIFNEPSVIAFDYYTHEVIAIGHQAANMIGRGHQGIKIVSPLTQGVISDMDSAKKMIEHALKKVENINVESSTVLICCPSEVTQLERDSLIGLAQNLGVRDIFIEEEVKAGGIGAGLDVYSSNGSMVLDIGGGSTDIGVLSLGDIVVSESIRTAGNYFDNAIMNYMQYEHGLLIGKTTAERIKLEIGSLNEEITEERTTTASGRDVVTGLPKKIVVTETEIRDVLIPPFETISNTILKVLQNTPAELSADIIKNGIVINGGGALITGIDKFLNKRIGLDFYISKNPLTAIVEGTKLLLKNRGSYFVKPTE
ncbi:MAG: rod shape-determining protein [Pleomorphochaeta sp.]